MINLIGTKRLVIIVILILVASLLGALNYLYALPQQTQLEQQERTLRSQLSSKRQETQNLANDFAQIQEQSVRFSNLEEAGFFNEQSRIVASNRIEKVQSFTRILAARYNIQPATVIRNNDLEAANHAVLDSLITVELDAIDDLDIYNFFYWFERALPGQVSITNLEIKKDKEITESRLRSIGSGQPVVMVTGQADFHWRTMVPNEDLLNSDGGVFQ